MLTFLPLLARLASDFARLPRNLTDSFQCQFWSHEQNVQVQLHGVKIRSSLCLITITYLSIFFFLRRSSSTLFTMPFSNLPAGRGYTHSQPIRKDLMHCVRKNVGAQSWCLTSVMSSQNRKLFWQHGSNVTLLTFLRLKGLQKQRGMLLQNE